MRRIGARAAVLLTLVLMAGLLGAASTVPAASEQIEVAPTTFRFDGGGWGHGVGMSQYGAFSRARAGHSAAQILAAYYPTANLTSAYPVPPRVRVHLATSADAAIEPRGELRLTVGGAVVATTRSRVVVDPGVGTFTVTDAAGTNLCIVPDPAGGGAEIDVCAGTRILIDFDEGSPVTLRTPSWASGRGYRWGALAFTALSSAAQYVVLEQLAMDRYLYGLAEVPASWPSATLQAQAVTGRSYATDVVERRRATSSWTNPWDLYSSTQDQAYLGLSHEQGPDAPRWQAAVDATSGQILEGDGAPVATFYSSSNGGHSEDSGYVFSTPYPWLPARPDRFDVVDSPHASWTRQYTADELSRWLARSSLGSVGTVRAIGVTGWLGDSGRTDRATVTIVGTTGTKTTTGWSLMAIINSGVVSEGGSLNRQMLSTMYRTGPAGTGPVGNEPVGIIDLIHRGDDRARAIGWAYDSDDATGTVPIRVTVDGTEVATGPADAARPDVSASFAQGVARGFDVLFPLPGGRHEVCVYGDDLQDGTPALIGCQVLG